MTALATEAVAAGAVALVVLVVRPLPARLPSPSDTRATSRPSLGRPAVAAAAGFGAWVFVGGAAGVLLGVLVAVWARRVLARAESKEQRRRRRDLQRDLPMLVDLVAAGLEAGLDPVEALAQACAALPGPAAEEVARVAVALRLGSDPQAAWGLVADEPALARVGRAMVRSHRGGTSVVDTVTAVAVELAADQAADTEDRARRVGVVAALPLGLCLLPAFLLIGIVPTVATLMSGVAP